MLLEPPSQHLFWQPKPVVGIPDSLPEAVSDLFDCCLADPRTGEYQSLELKNYVGPGTTITRHGSYFPAGFAVCWDGLAHPVARPGTKVDLGAHVSTASETSWVSVCDTPTLKPSLVIAILLLLRLDEQQPARHLFSKFPVESRRAIESKPQPYGNCFWFESAANDCFRTAYNQAVAAHACADDSFTMNRCEFLLRALPKLRAKEAKLPRALPRIRIQNPTDLLADARRRLHQPPRLPLHPNALLSITPAARMAELIARLEDISEEPINSGIRASPIYQTLVHEGAAAIDPLLQAVEHDDRLTRSYSLPRSVHELHPVSVSEAAQEILWNCGVSSNLLSNATARRSARIHNKSIAERALDLLAADDSNEFHWLAGVQTLFSPNDNFPGLRVDLLRDRTSPSVSQLLAKRAAAFTESFWANAFALLLFQCDPPASIKTLREQLKVSGNRGYLYGFIVAALAQVGETSALHDWAAELQPDHAILLHHLVPIWTTPESDTLSRVTRNLFLDANAPLSPAGMLAAGKSPHVYLPSPLLISPTFRESVLHALACTEVIGTFERWQDGHFHAKTPFLNITRKGELQNGLIHMPEGSRG